MDNIVGRKKEIELLQRIVEFCCLFAALPLHGYLKKSSKIGEDYTIELHVRFHCNRFH